MYVFKCYKKKLKGCAFALNNEEEILYKLNLLLENQAETSKKLDTLLEGFKVLYQISHEIRSELAVLKAQDSQDLITKHIPLDKPH